MNVSHYPQTTLSIFENALIQLHKPFSVVRFMNWQQINRLPNDTRPVVREWEDLPTIDEDWEYRGGPWGAFRGVPLVEMVRFANRINARPWLHVPIEASDELIERMIAFVIEGSNQKPIFEFANEIWNGTFKQFQYAVRNGRASNLADNDFQAALRWQCVRTRTIAQAAQGSADIVIAAQFFNEWVAEQLLEQADDVVTALAVAPYVGRNQRGLRMQKDRPTARPMLAIHNELIAEIYEDVAPRVASYRKLCDRANVKLFAYEGGMHQIARNEGNLEAFQLEKEVFRNFNRSPFAGIVTEKLWQMWQEQGGELFCPYSLATVYENPYTNQIQNQFFGHTEILGRQLRVLPKYRGAVNAANAPDLNPA
jgi:hypothetical protein